MSYGDSDCNYQCEKNSTFRDVLSGYLRSHGYACLAPSSSNSPRMLRLDYKDHSILLLYSGMTAQWDNLVYPVSPRVSSHLLRPRRSAQKRSRLFPRKRQAVTCEVASLLCTCLAEMRYAGPDLTSSRLFSQGELPTRCV